MPAIDFDFLQKLHVPFDSFKYFVETGTLNGSTTFSMEPYFEHIHTIEIAPHYFHRTRANYSGNKITFHLGDSSKVLPALAPTLDRPTIFFLDGHWSCDDTGKGEIDCPLLEELQALVDKCAPESLIIIDDMRLTGTNYDVDWSNVTADKIMQIVQPRLQDSYYLDSSLAQNDRLIVHLRAQS